MSKIMQNPCLACPYRRDVPSGVWSESEYDKLPPYDSQTANQPFAPFACHALPDHLCHGWAVCHSNRGHDRELLALRFLGDIEIPISKVPLFSSGQEAAEHGKRDVPQPTTAATSTIDRLRKKYDRLNGF